MSLPQTMTYVRLDGFGGPDVLKPDTMPVPQPGEGEVLVKVAAAGVNRPDVQQRLGQYNPPPGASTVPGLEIAGEVVAAGSGCRRFKAGDKVCALVSGGGYAEYCVAPEPQALPVPKGLSLVEAGGVPETFFTVWTNVFERGRLEPGETLLIHGGSSGIGTTAIQLARAFGARVLCTVGSDDKAKACEALGAERAINYRNEDFVAVTKELTGGKGVDVILDMVGGSYVPRNIRALAVEGRMVQIAWLGGSKVKADFMMLMIKRLTWTGSTLRPRTVEQKGEIARALEARVWPLIEAGKVKPVMFRTFPMAEAAEAHRLMESSAHIGKIVLVTATT
ncbi:MAG: NAD(P)H-quinone oxidoreductase [Hyphomicrobiaceae bacterium]|nr:NAD(P)H-quinone oxidoreductase [Hyphomicrobiaceae bacterium]